MDPNAKFVTPKDVAYSGRAHFIAVIVEGLRRSSPVICLPMCLGDLLRFLRRRGLDQSKQRAVVIRDPPDGLAVGAVFVVGLPAIEGVVFPPLLARAYLGPLL